MDGISLAEWALTKSNIDWLLQQSLGLHWTGTFYMETIIVDQILCSWVGIFFSPLRECRVSFLFPAPFSHETSSCSMPLPTSMCVHVNPSLHMGEKCQVIYLWICLTSLTLLISSFTHFHENIFLCAWHHIFFHSYLDGHLDWLHSLIIMNSGAINMIDCRWEF